MSQKLSPKEDTALSLIVIVMFMGTLITLLVLDPEIDDDQYRFIYELKTREYAEVEIFALPRPKETRLYRIDNKSEFEQRIQKYMSDGKISEYEYDKLFETLIDVEYEQEKQRFEQKKRAITNLKEKIKATGADK